MKGHYHQVPMERLPTLKLSSVPEKVKPMPSNIYQSFFPSLNSKCAMKQIICNNYTNNILK